MIFTEESIDFTKISSKDFEELCFDLLLKFGFEGLIWRQGGADCGRDIEGKYSVFNPIVEKYEEKWFFECKNHSSGISVDDISSKIAWADAERPAHFVLLASSYLTNDCRTWLEKVSLSKSYRIHYLEGKALKKIVLNNNELLSRYFADKYTKLLLDARKTWLIYDLLPEPPLLSLLSENIDISILTPDELAFIWCSYKIKAQDIDNWCESNESFSFDFLWNPLSCQSNCVDSVLKNYNDIAIIVSYHKVTCGGIVYMPQLSAVLILDTKIQPKLCLYSFSCRDDNSGLEILIEGTSDYLTRIRYMDKYAGKEIDDAYKILYPDRK